MKQQKKLNWIKKISPILYDIVVAGVCIYLAIRIREWMNFWCPFDAGPYLVILFTLLYILDLMSVKGVPCTRKKPCAYIVGISTFIILYLFMSNVLVDIFQWVVRFFVYDSVQLRKISVVCGYICMILTAVSTLWGMCHAEKLVTVHYATVCPKVRRNIRAVLLTDLHIGYFIGVKHIKKVVSAVNRLCPDIVLISGDIINAGHTKECPQIEEVADILAELKSAKGTFGVVGNHDPDASDPTFQRFLDRARIRLLEDEIFTDDDIQIVGRTTKTKPRKNLGSLMEKVNRKIPTIVLDHDPIGIQEAVKEKADYVFCGHTHKGQIFPLSMFVRFLYSKDELWGKAENEGTISIVSAGAGFFSVPMRTGSDSEIVSVDIKNK